MIVWGGGDGSQVFKYWCALPSQDQQMDETATAGAPAARGLHVAVWTGKEMVVWAGTMVSICSIVVVDLIPARIMEGHEHEECSRWTLRIAGRSLDWHADGGVGRIRPYRRPLRSSV